MSIIIISSHVKLGNKMLEKKWCYLNKIYVIMIIKEINLFLVEICLLNVWNDYSENIIWVNIRNKYHVMYLLAKNHDIPDKMAVISKI